MNGSPSYNIRLIPILCSRPQAAAEISGSDAYPGISGVVRLYQTGTGVVVYAAVRGLPCTSSPRGGRVFGFHIHEGGKCRGAADEPFSAAMSHYDPNGCPHPYHAGDLPPLFGNDGFALSLFLTNRFTVSEVIGKAIIIHGSPDDFTSQPAGNSGERIACGIIRQVGRGGIL